MAGRLGHVSLRFFGSYYLLEKDSKFPSMLILYATPCIMASCVLKNVVNDL